MCSDATKLAITQAGKKCRKCVLDAEGMPSNMSMVPSNLELWRIIARGEGALIAPPELDDGLFSRLSKPNSDQMFKDTPLNQISFHTLACV